LRRSPAHAAEGQPFTRGKEGVRMKRCFWTFAVGILLFTAVAGAAQRDLIPMDSSQTNHLKAYGLIYHVLARGQKAHWLLNYRGGSFLADASDELEREAHLSGVSVERIGDADASQIDQVIAANNMDDVLLEKAPRVAVYKPPGQDPWDDAVTMVLDYAEIPYDKIWDTEVLGGKLSQYDWLHLHHEDFTGQFGKFYGTYRNVRWYQKKVYEFEKAAHEAGFATVPQHKAAVARAIQAFVGRGGFLFAMCLATDTLDIALAAGDTDIVPPEIDHTPVDPAYQSKLHFERTFAFKDFRVDVNPLTNAFSNIDVNQVNSAARIEPQPFSLFEFSAKYDPVPSMLTQDHVKRNLPGFKGQTTTFNPATIRDSVVILGKEEKTGAVRYLHGDFGEGTFTFYGGHDPEDMNHLVGELPTDVSLFPNSPGYRLILNNILFPAAKKKKLKT
jgi:hypothetical protein